MRVLCIDDGNSGNSLVSGTWYEAIRDHDPRSYVIQFDDGRIDWFFKSRFINHCQIRDDKLNQLLNK